MAVTAGDIGMAAIVGWTLGAPHVGRTSYRRLTGYEPVPHQMSPGAPLDAWWAIEWHLQQGRDIGELVTTYLQHWESLERETAIARFNWENGHSNVGRWCNPWADGSEALARVIPYGIFGNNDPATSGGWAMMDAQCDHGAEGMLPALICARWIASRSLEMPQLENNAEFEEIADTVINTLRSGGPEQLHSKIVQRTPGLGAQSAIRSFAWIVAGVVAGQGDFSKSVLTTASFGGATHHTSAVTAAVLAAAGRGPTSEWTKPLGNTYVATTCLTSIEPPKSLEEMRLRLNAMPSLPPPRVSTPDMQQPTSMKDASARPFVIPSHAESALWWWVRSDGTTVSMTPHSVDADSQAMTGRFRCAPGSYLLVAEGATVTVNGQDGDLGFESDGWIQISVEPHAYQAALVVLDYEGRVVPLESVHPA